MVTASVAIALGFQSAPRSDADLAARVADLERRVAKLEAQPGSGRGAGDDKGSAPQPKWKDVSIWRQLSNGLSMEQIKTGLGEPTKVFQNGEHRTTWYYGYPSGGTVEFMDGRVFGWSEP